MDKNAECCADFKNIEKVAKRYKNGTAHGTKVEKLQIFFNFGINILASF
jgi:hypothetical protein